MGADVLEALGLVDHGASDTVAEHIGRGLSVYEPVGDEICVDPRTLSCPAARAGEPTHTSVPIDATIGTRARPRRG